MRSHPTTAEAGDPARWVDDHGDALFRFALARVVRRDVAEELVQETLLAAWQARRSFDGRANFRTWLIGILRRKIADFYRNSGRETPLRSGSPRGPDAAIFNARGKWIAAPRKWSQSPDQLAENSEFWRIVAACISDLPIHLAQAFELREIHLMPVSEICTAAGVTAKNLSVRLHRARLLLRQCLERRWFCPE